MIPANFEYTRATSLQDALQALGTPGATAISGGQSLIPLLRFRKAAPSHLVDIGGLSELRGITRSGASIAIGAATTYRELMASSELHAAAPLVPEVAELVGDLQLRNRGTVGGALVYADPYADMTAVMLALGATLHLQSSAGSRTVAARDFFTGPFTTVLGAGELLVSISIPVADDHTGTAYANYEKSASGYSQVGVAVSITRGAGGTIAAATVAVTSVAPIAYVAPVSEILIGTDGNAEVVARAAAAAVAGVQVYPDPHTTPAYRVHLATVAARQAITNALSRAS